MNYAHPTIDHNKIQYQAAELPQALQDAQVQCEMCSNILQELALDHCTGTEHWRDAKADNRHPKLYIIHPLNKPCPIHGDPEPGKRIRTYVGTRQAKIEQAHEAITRHRHYKNAFRELQDLHRHINSAHYAIADAWRALGLSPPDPDDLQTQADFIEG